MQTFITDRDPSVTAKILDTKRLGKQRVETVQIANVLLDPSKKGWANHPAVKMWRGYEAYLVNVYLLTMIIEWERRGFQGKKCLDHYYRLIHMISTKGPVIHRPLWFSEELFLSHKSNLIRKDPHYYIPIFGTGIPDDLPYIWPVN